MISKKSIEKVTEWAKQLPGRGSPELASDLGLIPDINSRYGYCLTTEDLASYGPNLPQNMIDEIIRQRREVLEKWPLV